MVRATTRSRGGGGGGGGGGLSFCSALGLVAVLLVAAAVGVALYTYRQHVYWDRQAGLKNWIKFNFRECAFDGGFQRCFEPLWVPLTLNLLPLALLAQALVARLVSRGFKPTGRPAQEYLPRHEYDLVELRHRHEARVMVLKLLFLVFLAYHCSTFEESMQLYGPTKGNARTKLTHTLTWMVAIPFGTLPVVLFGWVVDGCVSVARGRMLKTFSALLLLATAVAEMVLVFTAFGTRTHSFQDVLDDGIAGFLETPVRSLVLLVFLVRLPGLARDVLAASLRNCFSSCALDKYQLRDDNSVLVVRPGPIGFHVAQPVEDKAGLDSGAPGLIVVEAETRGLRKLEQRKILEIQTVLDEEPVKASIEHLKARRSYSRVLYFDTNENDASGPIDNDNTCSDDGTATDKKNR